MLLNRYSHFYSRFLRCDKTNSRNKEIKSSVLKLIKEKDTSNKMKDTVFVRHAHSEFNRAC